MTNGLTIDVEDYYMVSAFADVVKFEDWHRYESRVERNTRTIIDLLGDHAVQATFFVLGWVAERHPKLVKDIHAAGHEVACHGYNHRLVYDLTPDEFRQDVSKAKAILEDITGAPVEGYRAASYSIVQKSIWALEVLIEEGFTFDSSIFPIHHDRYGYPGAKRFPHAIRTASGDIAEFPPSTIRFFNQNIPIAGGGYLRLLPSPVMRRALRAINEKEKMPVIVYLHPWEIDAEQPRMNGRLRSRFRHYLNLKSTMPKLKHMLDEFEFRPISSLAAEQS